MYLYLIRSNNNIVVYEMIKIGLFVKEDIVFGFRRPFSIFMVKETPLDLLKGEHACFQNSQKASFLWIFDSSFC
jgi:hypothetical protein